MDDNTNNGITAVYAYCSGCLDKTEHQPVLDKRGIFRKRHQCSKCRANTVHCWVPGCSHMAIFRPKKKTGEPRRLGKSWCAEHGGEIASFEKLAVRLRDLDEWNNYFERDTKNMRKVVKRVWVTVGVVSVAIPVAQMVAPAIAARLGAASLLGAASTGTKIATLSGAALEKASLAYIGGGAVSVGGGGVAIGTGIVAAGERHLAETLAGRLPTRTSAKSRITRSTSCEKAKWAMWSSSTAFFNRTTTRLTTGCAVHQDTFRVRVPMA